MKMNNVSVGNKSFLLILGVLGFGLASCVGDKTVDDWRNGQVSQKKAAVQPILGVYTGSLISSQDGQALGTLKVSIDADETPQASYNNLGSELQNVVRGSLVYSGITNAQIPFSQGYYDEKTGAFNASISIQDNLGKAVPLTLKGKIANGQFTGLMYAQGYDNFNATFTVSKNSAAPPVAARGPVAARAKLMTTAATQKFAGMIGGSTPVTLTMIYTQIQNEQLFLNILLPKTPLTVNLYFPDPDLESSYLFTAASLDESTNQMKAAQETVDATSGMTFHLNLDCIRTVSGGSTLYWDCTFTDGNRKQVQIHFTPTN